MAWGVGMLLWEVIELCASMQGKQHSVMGSCVEGMQARSKQHTAAQVLLNCSTSPRGLWGYSTKVWLQQRPCIAAITTPMTTPMISELRDKLRSLKSSGAEMSVELGGLRVALSEREAELAAISRLAERPGTPGTSRGG